MAMTNRNNRKNDCIILDTIDSLVPQDHFIRQLEESIDWNFVYPLCKPLYSDFGRPSIDPVVLFKLIFINIIFGYNSMRKTCEECKYNIIYRWFLGLSIYDEVPNYSTWSQNYIRRYGDSDVFDMIFQRILMELDANGFLDVTTVFGDGTHMKASANKRKATDKEVEIAVKHFDEALLEEINQSREENGKKPFDSLVKEELRFNEATGEEEKVKKTKHIKESTTDPESGMFHKGEKEKCFAYEVHTMCDAHGYVLASDVFPGNVHDSVAFFKTYNKVMELFEHKVQNICLDSGYKTPAICREVLENNQNLFTPYKRPMTKEGYFRKNEYAYDEQNDCYICPLGIILPYSTTDRTGYHLYKSRSSDCESCPLKEKCTKSKNNVKVVTRHVWAEYIERVEDMRLSPKWKEEYPKRKETVERVFADCKEKSILRYTRLRGLLKNQHQVLMVFACHNLKKMAKHKARMGMI
jgi:transposase